MPPIRIRRPSPSARTRTTLHLANMHDPYLLHSLERREVETLAAAHAEEQVEGTTDRLNEIQDRLHIRDFVARTRLLNRLQHNPALQRAVRSYWDTLDTTDFLEDLQRTMHTLSNLCRDRRRVHMFQLLDEQFQMLALDVHTLIANVSPGLGTPDDPVDRRDAEVDDSAT